MDMKWFDVEVRITLIRKAKANENTMPSTSLLFEA